MFRSMLIWAREPNQYSIMRFRRQVNERTRSILWLELAVVIPAAALVILAAWHLNHIKQDRAVEAAIDRDFFQVMAISEKQINKKAGELIEDVRTDFPAPGNACSETLDRILAAHPYAAHLYVYDPAHGSVFRSEHDRLENDPAFRAESEYMGRMFDSWMKMEFDEVVEKLVREEKKNDPYPYYVFSNRPARGDKHLYQSGAIFLIKGKDADRPAVGAIVFDAEYLDNQFFPEMLNAVLNRNLNDSANDKNRAVMMVHPKNEWSPLAASAGWDGGEPEIERNMEVLFPGLTLAMKLRGTTVAAIGHHFARIGFLVLGGVSLLLAGGIYLNYHSVSKEMKLARLKSDFVSNVSHELRTPLSLIRLYAETLEMGRLTNPEKYQEYYEIIRKESERLTALINNILDFSRIEAGRKEYEFRETDVRELVENTLESYRYQIQQNGFTFEERIEEVPRLRVDREAMARSLLNLVNNALKYSQDRKYIGVNLFRDNGSVKLEVIDQGIGIPPEEQEKIFEKFYRVGDPLVHTTKGTGLGLSLVRHIVQAHGGAILVDSIPGRGSKFTITLPVDPVQGRAQAASA
jgi:signal transduction histidine kinase